MMNEVDIYERQGFGNQSGFGKQPALLIVDFVNAFANPDEFGGGNIGEAITKTKVLLTKSRLAEIPISFTRVIYAEDGSDAGVFCLKAPGLLKLTEVSHGSQVVDDLAPGIGEYIVRKTQPSAFFGTSLASWLHARLVDTLLVTGCTTSGCIRASVVDAMSYNFQTVVVTDCVGDRAIAPHDANLFDMEQKYADLMTSEEVIAELSQPMTT